MIDMKGYKMIYENKVYNALNLILTFIDNKVDSLEVIYINEDNIVCSVTGLVDEFKFIKE